MKQSFTAALFFATSTLGGAVSEERRSSSGTATVNIAKSVGEATFLGSNFIYGWPDNGTEVDTSIPDYLVTDIKFNACRAGGAQIEAPGWTKGGYEGYIGRFNSTLSNYRTTRKYGGDFILLIHDLWGADGGSGSSSPYPGDNGNWIEMEVFLAQLIDDIKVNDMLDGLVMNIWNEPELEIFWARSWTQYVEYYVRASKIVRAGLPDTLISGPSMAHSPTLDSDKLKAWMASVSGNGTVPDIYSWHQIGVWERQPDITIPDFATLREQYNLPVRPFDINEYAWTSEQNPANSVYYLAQCERHNLRCLRANWGGGSDLHNYMGNLIYKTNGTYYPNGEWQLYKYYAGMTGNRVETSASTDLLFDVFATTSENTLKIIAGTRTVQEPYDINISGLSTLGLPISGTVNFRTYRFDWDGSQGQVNAAVDLGFSEHTYSEDTLTIYMDPLTNSTAYAYELS